MKIERWYLDELRRSGLTLTYQGEPVTNETELPDSTEVPGLVPKRGPIFIHGRSTESMKSNARLLVEDGLLTMVQEGGTTTLCCLLFNGDLSRIVEVCGQRLYAEDLARLEDVVKQLRARRDAADRRWRER